MKWLEAKLLERSGSENWTLPTSARDIADAAEAVLDAEAMRAFVSEFFGMQKSFGDFLGVGESTVAGWMKSGAFPAYAKRAALSAYLARAHGDALLEARRDAVRPKVVKDGERHLVVRFDRDELGITPGSIVARDIPIERDALALASTALAWELLDDAAFFIEAHAPNEEDPDEYFDQLRGRIIRERKKTFERAKAVEDEISERELRSLIYNLTPPQVDRLIERAEARKNSSSEARHE